MRSIAIRGMACLAAVVCISMFFSGTIKTMTTAKVQTVTAREGRLEERVRLSGRLVFPQTAEVRVPGVGDDVTLSVKAVYVGQGRWVEAGEPLFSAEVSGYQTLIDACQADFDAAQSDAFEIDRKMGTLRLTRTEEMWLAAYDELTEAGQAVLAAQTALGVHDNLYGGEQSEAREALTQALEEAQRQNEAAQNAFDQANRMGVNQELMQLVLDARDAQTRMRAAGDRITALGTLKEQAACVCAPHAGFVVSLSVTAGETYDGRGPAVVMSVADEQGGVLRADLSATDKRIEIGTKIAITGGGEEISAEVTARGIDVNGSWYADVAVTRAQIAQLGGAAHLMDADTSMTCTYRAQASTTLLPVSAVRGTGDNRYVYLVTERSNALGETTMTVFRQDIHVLAETEDTVSIEENLGRQRVAYMEDRPISDGTEVMVYAQ